MANNNTVCKLHSGLKEKLDGVGKELGKVGETLDDHEKRLRGGHDLFHSIKSDMRVIKILAIAAVLLLLGVGGESILP
ncbi:unnamed protein product, partial [marine sediment metagenome]